MRGWPLLHPATGHWFLPLLIVATIAIETFFVGPLQGFAQPTIVGLPISVCFGGEKIAINGYFYRASGLLMTPKAHVEEEEK